MFEVGDTNLLLLLARGTFVAALFSAFGALLFIRVVAPQGLKLVGAGDAASIERRSLRLVRVSLAAALVALLGWLVLETSDMSNATNVTDVAAAIPAVLLETSFGRDLTAQALSVLAALSLRRGRSDGALRQWGWRGSRLCFKPGTATPSPWSMARASCSMRRDCIS